MNKYEKALETIGKTYTDDCQHICDWEEYELLQELIDENKDWCDGYALLLKEKAKIERALDKACEYLDDKVLPPLQKTNFKYDKKAWKEYLLKESDEQ